MAGIEVSFMGELSTHTHECPRCGTQWECDGGNYQDECPYPLQTLCTKCWAKQKPEKPVLVKKGEDREVADGIYHR